VLFLQLMLFAAEHHAAAQTCTCVAPSPACCLPVPADAGELQDQEQPTQPAITNLKPATLESLGTGAAAERQRTAALASLQAAAVRPRQLASAVQGACMTVTGSSGQRVYCQLDAARPQGEGGAPRAVTAAAAAVGGGVGGVRGRGLLAQPIEALLDQLAEKRRQVRAPHTTQQTCCSVLSACCVSLGHSSSHSVWHNSSEHKESGWG
jgi:hypothetical protein